MRVWRARAGEYPRGGASINRNALLAVCRSRIQSKPKSRAMNNQGGCVEEKENHEICEGVRMRRPESPFYTRTTMGP